MLTVSIQWASLPNCIDFIDGTKIFMSRPREPILNQQLCYSGHKKRQCLIYLTVTTPDGLMFYLYGSEVGSRHDVTLYRQSGLDDALQELCGIKGQQFYVYGNSAFIMRTWMQIAFNRSVATIAKNLFNNAMSSAREAVEWGYKDVKQKFTTLDISRILKVSKASIALMYKMDVWLWILKVCLHGGE